MKMLLSVAVSILFAGSASAGWNWTPESGWVLSQESVLRSVVVPPGMHAHTRTDGSVFIHGDENYGKAVPHAGVERPWPKTGLPGQTVLVGESSLLTVGDCPNGQCPTTRRGPVARVAETSTRVVERTAERVRGFNGPVRRLLARLLGR